MEKQLTKRPKTKILVDGGDPGETEMVKKLLGFVDGQTTNPSLIAKNTEVIRLVRAGQKLTEQKEVDEYRNIVRRNLTARWRRWRLHRSLCGSEHDRRADVSTGSRNVFMDPERLREVPVHLGRVEAEMSVRDGIRVNLTLCFSQQQAAAVYAVTRGTAAPAYVSPFVGRLDDIGQNGVDLVADIKRMYGKGDGHVLVLAASIRSLAHLLYCFSIGADLVTVPPNILRQWAEVDQPWQSFDIHHELTTRGVEKFAPDYRATLYLQAS
jgi:transaldolase